MGWFLERFPGILPVNMVGVYAPLIYYNTDHCGSIVAMLKKIT